MISNYSFICFVFTWLLFESTWISGNVINCCHFLFFGLFIQIMWIWILLSYVLLMMWNLVYIEISSTDDAIDFITGW